MTASEISSADDETKLYDALANARRRQALRVLCESDAPLALADLAREVAAREESGTEASDEAIERVQISLYHVHLPKLEESGVVEFDPSQRTVSLAETSLPIERWL